MSALSRIFPAHRLFSKKHKLYSEDNPTGWKVRCKNFPDSKLDEMEQYYIKMYTSKGYQLRNVSLGGQGEGRNMINDTKPARGYRDGVAQGRRAMARDISSIIDKHLITDRSTSVDFPAVVAAILSRTFRIGFLPLYLNI